MDEKIKILRYIYSKYNELTSVKKFLKEEDELYKIIQGKQDTLNDMEKLLKSGIDYNEYVGEYNG